MLGKPLDRAARTKGSYSLTAPITVHAVQHNYTSCMAGLIIRPLQISDTLNNKKPMISRYPLFKDYRVWCTHLVDISMAICTDFMRLSLMCWSTGSMLWTSMFVMTCKQWGHESTFHTHKTPIEHLNGTPLFEYNWISTTCSTAVVSVRPINCHRLRVNNYTRSILSIDIQCTLAPQTTADTLEQYCYQGHT